MQGLVLHPNAKDLTGKVFGRLKVLHPARERLRGQLCWECSCECGGTTIGTSTALQKGLKRSCGCLLSDSRTKDLTGMVFGRLTVIAQDKSHVGSGGSIWFCKCSCGNDARVRGGNLTRGLTKSCGCYKRELHTTHGYSRNPHKVRVYRIWNGMRQRCQNPKNIAYRCYGARGIKVCDRWQKFENFLADMGEPAPHLSLDRINPAGNYEPGNCRWADSKTQSSNRRTSRQLAIEDLTIADLQRLLAEKISARNGARSADLSAIPARQ